MSDWNMYEIEDVMWDVFGACSDHIVPHPDGNSVNEVKAQHDTNKKARPDLRNSADDIADLGEHNIFHENVFNSSLENCQGNVGHLLHETSDNIGFRNGENMEMKNSGILDCQWPEFDDIGDVDYMLRHGYTTFGQGSGGTANELSWFTSSSHTIDDSDGAIKSSMQSSCSELNALKSYSDHPEASMTGWPEKVTTSDNHEESCLDYDSYSQWLDADVQNLLVSEKLSNGYATGGSRLSSNIDCSDPNCRDTFQVSNIANNDGNMSMSSQIDGIKADQNSGYFSGSYNSTGQSACYGRKLDNSLKTFTSEFHTTGMAGDLIHTRTHSLNHIPLDGSNLEVMHIVSSHMEIEPSESNEFLDQSQTIIKSAKVMATKLEKRTAMDMKPKLQHEDTEKNTKSSSSIVNSSERNISEHVSSKSNTVENKLEIMESHTGGGTQLGNQDAAMASSIPEINNSSLQGSSCTASSGSILSGSSSLQRLQEVTSQLDIKTKLCIRDGLYRLARNAKKRHNPDVIRYGCKEEMITSNIMVANDSHRIPRLLYEETGTNQIDRSIAYLLFYKASGHCVGPADDAMSA